MLEEGRLAHVGRAGIPGEELALGHRQPLPALVAVEDAPVLEGEEVGRERARQGRLDLLRARPDVAQVHRPVGAVSQRIGGEVGVDAAGQRIGHHERRRGQVVGAHRRVDASLEVAIAREHGGHLEVVALDRAGDLVGQRPGVADARGAAEADQVEADLVERRHQPGPLEVADHDPRARCQAGLDPRLRPQPELERLPGDQAGRDHQRRVGGVGARRDRRDHDRAVAEAAAVGRADRRTRPRTSAPPAAATPGPAGGAARPRRGRPPRGRARASRCRPGRPRSRRGRAPARACSSPRGRSGRAGGRCRPGSAGSGHRPGMWRTWRRTPATCSTGSPGRPRSASPGPGRRTR